jgi:uncharacterized protein involved in exopolysaccharide biosynthesis
MKFTFRDLLNSVLRYSRPLILFSIAVVIAVMVFSSQTRKSYESRAKILVSLGSEVLGRAEYLNSKNLQVLQREQQIHNEEEILQSHSVMLTTAKWIVGDATPSSPAPIKDFRLDEAKRLFTGQTPEPTFVLRTVKAAGDLLGSLTETPKTHAEQLEDIAQQISKGLAVKVVFDSDTLDASFRCSDARVAQTVLNLIIAAYLEHHIAIFQSASEPNLLKKQLDLAVQRYSERLADFSAYMDSHGVYNDDTQGNLLVEQRQKLVQVLNDARADRESTVARLAALQQIRQSLEELERYRTMEVRNKEREGLISKLNDELVAQQTLLSRHPKGSRADQEEQKKLDELRRLLENQPEQVMQEVEQRRSQASDLLNSDIVSVTEAEHGHAARIEQLRSDLGRMDSEISRYANALKGFNALKLELAFAKRESEQMAQAYVDSRLKMLTAQNAITDISVIDAPTWDPKPASPKRKVLLAVSVLLLLVGSLGVLLACISLDTTVADKKTAELRLGTPVVGTFPVMRRMTHQGEFPEVFTTENQREFARIYQSVRKLGPDGKLILLAESEAKEGASLLGYGLALFLTRYAGERTAFIDRTTHPMEAPAAAGDEHRGVVFVNVEALMGKAGDLVSKLSQLKQEFAYIVISAGGVKDTTDLLALSGVVSVTFLIVEAGTTRYPAVHYSLDLLRRYGFQGIELILNKRVFYIPGWLMRFV